MPVAEARLDGERDPVHHADGFDRVLADRRLAREHDRGGAVEDRVGDVGCLRARRLGRVDHRLEHLRRGDHGLPVLERAHDDALLQERHLGGADLHAEVAARDHHAVRLGEDLVEHRDRLRLLDLRDHPGVRAARLDERPERLDVGCRADERERDVVDAEAEGRFQVVEILAGERRDRERHTGQVHALVREDDASDDHVAARPATLDARDPQSDVAVVDEDVIAQPGAPTRARPG